MGSQLIRTFIALNLPTNLRASLAITQSQLRKKLPYEGIKWTDPDQFHLTLRFIGEITQTEVQLVEGALHEIVKKFKPFTLSPAGLGVFPDFKHPRVIWVGMSGQIQTLSALAHAILEATKEIGQVEEREFHPHLTLARVKTTNPGSLRAIGNAIRQLELPPLGEWSVTQVDLMKSTLTPHGPIYECMQSISLNL